MSRALDGETIDAFCVATLEILSEATGIDAELECETDAGEIIVDPIVVLLHARGDLLFGLTWTFPASITRAVAMRMVDGLEPDRELCCAAAGELANIVTGRSAHTFEQRGYRVEIDPPETAVVGPPGLARRFATACGPIEVVFHSSRRLEP